MHRDGLTPNELQRVLTKAIALDENKRSKYADSEMRYAASQVGVSPESLEEALRVLEMERGSDLAAPDASLLRLMRIPTLIGFVAGGVIAALYGVAVARFAQGSAMNVPNYLLNGLMVGSGALTMFSASARSRWSYLTQNLGLWFGFGMGVYMVYKIVTPHHLIVGAVLSHVLEVPIFAFLVSSCVGGLMISRRRKSDDPDGDPGSAAARRRTLSDRWARFKDFMTQRIDFTSLEECWPRVRIHAVTHGGTNIT